MRKQQRIWQAEHHSAAALPSEMGKNSTDTPSQYVVQFYDFLKKSHINTRNAVDIGAGKGRNSIFFAEHDFTVHALDYIQAAVDHIELVAKRKALPNIQAYCIPIDKPWPFDDNIFSIGIDSFASIDIETRKGREVCRDELFRTLKSGGYAMVTVVAAEDEIESELLKASPGPEKNSTIWPQNGKFQKNYDEAELRDFYRKFEIVSLEKIKKPSHKLGRDFVATNFKLILRKP